MAYDFELLTVETSGRVATVTIDNPPDTIHLDPRPRGPSMPRQFSQRPAAAAARIAGSGP